MITSSKTWTDGPEWEVFQGEERPALCTSNICHGKGSGGGGQQQMQPQQTTSTVTQSNLPEYARPYFENLLNRAQNDVSSQGYQPYGGQRVADTPYDTNVGYNLVRSTRDVFEPSMQNAINTANVAGTMAGNANNTFGGAANLFNAAGQMGTSANFDPQMMGNTYSPQNVSNTYQAQSYTPDNWLNQANSYMSPYMQNVIDIAKREANRQWDMQGINTNTQATQAGAFGGYRHQVLDAENMKNRQTQLDDIQQKGLQDAYSQGIGAFNADRNAAIQSNQLNNQFGQAQSQLGLTAGQMNNQFGQAASQLGMQAGDLNNRYNSLAAQLGLQGGQLALGAGQGMLGIGQGQLGAGQLLNQTAGMQGNLGTTYGNNMLTAGNAMNMIGGQQQALQQAGLDTAYQDFVNQRDYDRQNLNWLSGILRGVPVSANTSTTGYMSAAAPNATSQIAGAGIGALGLSKLLG